MAREIKDSNYIVIQGWMYNIGCKSLQEIAVYALIYGFSQDDSSDFRGPFSYIQQWLMCSKPTAISVIKSLIDKGLIQKIQDEYNGVVFNRYVANVPKTLPVVKIFNRGSKEFLQWGSKEFLPNNNIINKNNINTTPTIIPQGGKRQKSEMDLSFIDRPEFVEPMKVWLAYKKEKGQTYKPMGLKQCYKKLVEYSGGDVKTAIAIIEQSMGNNYSGLFPLKNQNYGTGNRNTQLDKFAPPTVGGTTYGNIYTEMLRGIRERAERTADIDIFGSSADHCGQNAAEDTKWQLADYV